MPLPLPLRRGAIALLLAGAAVFAAVLAAEAVARLGVGLGTPPLSVADPGIEYLFAPNQQVWRFHNRIAINRYGMRSPDFPPQRPPSQRRVLVFGDSVVFGGSTLDQDAIATTLLARRLGPRALVGNVSAGSWGPGNWLGWLRRFGTLQATDVVLVTSSHDLFDNPTFAPLNPLTHPTRNPPSASWELWQRYLWPRLRPAAGHPSALDGAPPAHPAQTPQAEQRGAADLTGLITGLRAAGLAPVVVQFWEREEVATGRMRPGHAQQRQLFRRLGVPALDAGPTMEHCARASGAKGTDLFIDEIHPFTPLGQRCLAQVLEQALRLRPAKP